jgi:Carboxypeptidase regulatory-like domain
MACAILLSAVIAFAHTPGAIAGRVLDRNGNPLSNVSVTAVNAVSGIEKHATTDSSGSYVIQPLPPARYILRAEAKSYGCIIVPEVIVEDGQRAQQDFRFTGNAAPSGCEPGSSKKSNTQH